MSEGSLPAGLYLPVEPTLGTAKTDASLKSGQDGFPYGFPRASTAGDDCWSWCRHKVCHPLPALTADAGSELASPSSEGTRLEITEQLPGKAVTLIARCACFGESVGAIRRRKDDNVIDDSFSSDEDNESSSNSSRTVNAAFPTPMFVPKPSALRARTIRGPAPGADDEQTRHGHDVTRSGQRSFRDTLDNPFGYPDSVLEESASCSICIYWIYSINNRLKLPEEAGLDHDDSCRLDQPIVNVSSNKSLRRRIQALTETP
ncbi:hypothetical protein J6590_025871 [Homalodisca vitripennis]|nr:hypothetical protein J6590_025871 [Homalodisca vitripennis]